MDKAHLKRMHQRFRPSNLRPRAASWYEIKNLSADTVEIALYDEIGAWGITASAFSDELRGVTAKNITLRISSPGGDVFDGLAILNALRQHPSNVNVVIEGLAASAASFIAMAGDTIQIAPQAMYMIHDASGVCMGNADDMLEMASLLDKASDNIAAVYAQRAGGTVEDWRALMKAETWYTDQEAVDAGLADSIVGQAPPEEPEDPEEESEEPDEDEETEKKPVKAPPATDNVVTPVAAKNPLAAWDFSRLREAVTTAAKEANSHG